MVTTRRYRQPDFLPAARLVWRLFAEHVLPDATPEGAAWWSAHLSPEGANRGVLRQRYERETISFVAIDGAQIVGLVMGTRDELRRLFVDGRRQRTGIGRRLVARFEAECLRQGGTRYRIVAGLSAVPFYEHVGCRKSTGVRNARGLKVQPMRRDLIAPAGAWRAVRTAASPSR
jgi:GNAT superfamily N-acetyltransferase